MECLISRGVPVKISDWELRNFDILVQMERTVSNVLSPAVESSLSAALSSSEKAIIVLNAV